MTSQAETMLRTLLTHHRKHCFRDPPPKWDDCKITFEALGGYNDPFLKEVEAWCSAQNLPPITALCVMSNGYPKYNPDGAFGLTYEFRVRQAEAAIACRQYPEI